MGKSDQTLLLNPFLFTFIRFDSFLTNLIKILMNDRSLFKIPRR